jgi:hypothetical protein
MQRASVLPACYGSGLGSLHSDHCNVCVCAVGASLVPLLLARFLQGKRRLPAKSLPHRGQGTREARENGPSSCQTRSGGVGSPLSSTMCCVRCVCVCDCHRPTKTFPSPQPPIPPTPPHPPPHPKLSFAHGKSVRVPAKCAIPSPLPSCRTPGRHACCTCMAG